jgi:hypothetical protein
MGGGGGCGAVTHQIEPYIDARELAVVMGVSSTTIKRMVADGMPSETWGMHRTRRFRATEAIAWARSRATDNVPNQTKALPAA